MTMRMMCVGHVRMRMAQRLVAVPVTVFAAWHHVMVVIMVSVIVTMRMLVLHQFVLVLVPVGLQYVQDDTRQHQQTT